MKPRQAFAVFWVLSIVASSINATVIPMHVECDSLMDEPSLAVLTLGTTVAGHSADDAGPEAREQFRLDNSQHER